MKASDNETVAEVLDDFAYLITLGNIGPNVATDVRNRIEAAHGREVAELKNKCEEYERQPELMAETAKAALELLKAQESKIAELRECLKEAIWVMQTLFDRKMPKWRKALEGANHEGK